MPFFTSRMYIKVEVHADAKKEIVEKRGDDSYFIAVRQKAEQNQANRRVMELIKSEFADKRIIIKIVSGHHSPHKILSIEFVDNS